MKRSAWIRLLAVVLVCCIVAAPTASAAPYARAAVTTVTTGSGTPADTAGTAASTGTAATGSFWSGLTGWFRSLFGGSDTPAADEGVNAAADTTTTLKYFPVTLYNYESNGKSINDATHQLEIDEESVIVTSRYSAKTVRFSDSDSNERYANGDYYVLVDGTYGVVIGVTRNKPRRYYTWTITYIVDGHEDSITTSRSSNSYLDYTLYIKEEVKQWTGIYFGGNDWGANVKGEDTYGDVTASYADWNKWTGDLGGHGNRTYSGLVEGKLDSNKNIVFKYPEAGIFTSSTTNKDVYTNVGLPCEYADGYYTFDANSFGAYFHTDKDQGTSSTPASNSNLYYTADPQRHNFSGQDLRTKGWFPFNDTNSVTTSADSGTADYFFGMNATLPFTMTSNGRINPADDSSKPITFYFSGDDDLWVFIDGLLVLDLGGVRNGLNATIDFANNTWQITAMNKSVGAASDVNGADMSGAIFNDGDVAGVLNQTRESFAAKDSHDLTIFYLERGAGSSNAQIKFNLPVKDSVSVKKQVNTTDSAGEPLEAATLEQINNIDFGFVLTKRGTPVANTTYDLLNENGQYLETRSTDSNGHFTLRNGQTAKFTGEIPDTGTTYVVREDTMAGWEEPSYKYTTQIGGSGVVPTTGTGNTVSVTGDDKTEDSVSFVCLNELTHVDGTSLTANDDYIVIDFGLPVVIDPLANDVVVEGTTSIVDGSVSDGKFGTATIKDGKITYQLTKQLTGVEVLTYTVKATANSGVVGDNKTATAKIYIIPATSMYYEENFTGLVTFNDGNSSGWQTEGTAQTDPQEPGVVGTVGDSPYGSDAAYLNDGGDSNGSSMYVDTTGGAASFSYTFTGTGTSFFARTSNTSGYMRVVITDKSGNTVSTLFRDTSYKTTDSSIKLYNIPVFTTSGLEYGTYTVTVTIAGGANAKNYGKDFWLDGIRVMNPLNQSASNYTQATGAYAQDGEANMAVVTLRGKLITEAQINDDNTISWNEGDNFVLFTDTNDKITIAEEYKSKGPKEEVYLDQGQSVTFSLTDWDPNTNKIYLGIKAPAGSGSVSINGNTLQINNATDCYYDISGYGTITTDEDGIKTVTFKIEANSSLISVTNIKVTGNAKFTIVKGTTTKVDGSEGSDENNEDIIVD